MHVFSFQESLAVDVCSQHTAALPFAAARYSCVTSEWWMLRDWLILVFQGDERTCDPRGTLYSTRVKKAHVLTGWRGFMKRMCENVVFSAIHWLTLYRLLSVSPHTDLDIKCILAFFSWVNWRTGMTHALQRVRRPLVLYQDVTVNI